MYYAFGLLLLIVVALSGRIFLLKKCRGHTSEMLKFLKTLDLGKYSPRIYVHAVSDTKSKGKAIDFEKSSQFSILAIPRSREVGQSYFTSVFTTLWSLVYSFQIVYKSSPDLILTNGPGTCLPILVCGWILRVLGKNNRLILLESYACVNNISLTAKLVHQFVDLYCVQWPGLAKEKWAVYTGRIRGAQKKIHKIIDRESYVLVTVGSTSFDELVSAIDCEEFVNKLKKCGFRSLHVQYGNSNYKFKFLADSREFRVKCYSYSLEWDKEVKGCSLVIGHSGAGTILDSLENEVPIIVVPNERLMNKHQSEMSSAMKNLGYLQVSNLSDLIPQFEVLLESLNERNAFPKTESDVFASKLECIIKNCD